MKKGTIPFRKHSRHDKTNEDSNILLCNIFEVCDTCRHWWFKKKDKHKATARNVFSTHMKVLKKACICHITYFSLADMSSAGPFRSMLVLALGFWMRCGFSSTCLAKAAFGLLADLFIRSSNMLMSFSESCTRRASFECHGKLDRVKKKGWFFLKCLVQITQRKFQALKLVLFLVYVCVKFKCV